jgi:hypothetical protein
MIITTLLLPLGHIPFKGHLFVCELLHWVHGYHAGGGGIEEDELRLKDVTTAGSSEPDLTPTIPRNLPIGLSEMVIFYFLRSANLDVMEARDASIFLHTHETRCCDDSVRLF